jgi:hypothetical protein
MEVPMPSQLELLFSAAGAAALIGWLLLAGAPRSSRLPSRSRCSTPA